MSKKKLIPGIDYCIGCEEPIISKKVLEDWKDTRYGGKEWSYYPFAVCMNKKCNRYGLVSDQVVKG